MVMRAVKKGRVAGDTDANREREDDIREDDGIVPVLFPKQTWDKIQEMARAYKVGPTEVLILALEQLDKEIRGE